MKKRFISLSLVGMTLVGLLGGCKADVDMRNIDTTVTFADSIGLPLGQMSMKLGDFLKDSTLEGLEITEDGMYRYKASATFDKPFHEIDLISYLGKSRNEFDLSAQLPPMLPSGHTIDLTFDMNLSFKDINNNISDERIDSIVVTDAKFMSYFDQDGIDFADDEITAATIVLGDAFHRSEKEIPISEFRFGQGVPVNISDFVLCTMKDITQPAGKDNVVNEVKFQLKLQIVTNQPHTVGNAASITYSTEVTLMDYDAIYGYFKASSHMRDAKDTLINDLWSGWGELGKFVLPLRRPQFNVEVSHQLGGMPMDIFLSKLAVYNDSVRKSAKFCTPGTTDTLTYKHFYLESRIALSDPYDKVSKDSLALDYTPENGQLGNLFSFHPDYIDYAFNVDADKREGYACNQFRVTNNTNVHLDIQFELPFDFDPGVDFNFDTELKGLNISEFSLDSLLQGVKFEGKKSIYLLLGIENYIPFEINLDLDFQDASGTSIMQSSVVLPMPTDVVDGEVVTPSKMTKALNLGDNTEKLSKAKTLVLHLNLGKNKVPAKLKATEGLRIAFNLTASVDGTFNFNN